jgi:hypothetical protein
MFLMSSNKVKAAFLEPTYKEAFCIRPSPCMGEANTPLVDTADIAAIRRRQMTAPTTFCGHCNLTLYISTKTLRLNFSSTFIRTAPPLLRRCPFALPLLNLYLRLLSFCSVELSPVFGSYCYWVIMLCQCLGFLRVVLQHSEHKGIEYNRMPQGRIKGALRESGADEKLFLDCWEFEAVRPVYALLIRTLMVDGSWLDIGLVVQLHGRSLSDYLNCKRIGMFYRNVKPNSKMECEVAHGDLDIYREEKISIRCSVLNRSNV